MLNNRLHAARAISAALNPAEITADDHCLATLQLGVALYEARKAAKVSIHTGQECFEEIHAAINHAHESRVRLLKAHRLFADLRDEVLPGISPRMVGDVGGCPPAKIMTERPDLRVAG
jgi:hypothetical protein